MTEHVRRLEATGERFIPEVMGGQLIEAEHQARYRLALAHVAGKAVLDAGCGVGWGSKLLLDAGAREVTGIDIDEDAVADACRRVPQAVFTKGDLMDLPIADQTMDVVVCFEALEHTADTAKTLDELKRVLRPGGLLFVSSPNPAVYPAGNPFHIHELTPEELHEAARARFGYVQMFRQHTLISSLILRDAEGDSAEQSLEMSSYSIVAIAPGNDPYSVAVASDAPLPSIEQTEVLAPSDQINDLGALASALTEERAAIHENHARIVDERNDLVASHNQALADLKRIGDAYGSAERQLQAAANQLALLTDERDRLAATEALATKQSALAAHDRDRFAAALVSAEQDLARAQGQTQVLLSGQQGLMAEIEALRSTISWRITKPIRAVRRGIARR